MAAIDQKVIIAGCGYVGERLYRRLTNGGARVTGLVRSHASAERLGSLGIDARVWDFESGPADGLLTGDFSDTLVFYLAPPPGDGPGDPRLDAFLQGLRNTPRRLVYMSTTGVYGDCGGALVDETRPTNPGTERARRRVAAEDRVRAWCDERQVRGIVLRVPGIYGPGRLPTARLRDGEPVIRADEAFPGNRIHVDDLVTVCVAAGVAANAEGTYNVGDGNHMTGTGFLERLAKIAGLPAPKSVTREEARRLMSSRRWSFLAESRRVDTTRMMTSLGVKLTYADPETGIRASLQEEQAE